MKRKYGYNYYISRKKLTIKSIVIAVRRVI